METQVEIVKNAKSGQIFTPGTKVSADGKSYGFYVVAQNSITEENGFIREEKRSALLTAENSLGAKLGYAEGTIKAGNIVRTESFTPFFVGQECVMNPTTGKAVLRDGKQFYRQDLFSADLTKADTLLPISSVSEAVIAPVAATSGLGN